MLKLIRLEYKKNSTFHYLMYSLIAAVFISAFIIAIDFSWGFEESDVMAGEAPSITFIVELMTALIFLAMSAIMHVSFTINAFKDKTIDLMFSYPIKRQKILISKIISVLIFNYIGLVITQGIIYGTIYIIGLFTPAAYSMNYDFSNIMTYFMILLKAAMVIF